jgi:hypothetical protein
MLYIFTNTSFTPQSKTHKMVSVMSLTTPETNTTDGKTDDGFVLTDANASAVSTYSMKVNFAWRYEIDASDRNEDFTSKSGCFTQEYIAIEMTEDYRTDLTECTNSCVATQTKVASMAGFLVITIFLFGGFVVLAVLARCPCCSKFAQKPKTEVTEQQPELQQSAVVQLQVKQAGDESSLDDEEPEPCCRCCCPDPESDDDDQDAPAAAPDTSAATPGDVEDPIRIKKPKRNPDGTRRKRRKSSMPWHGSKAASRPAKVRS